MHERPRIIAGFTPVAAIELAGTVGIGNERTDIQDLGRGAILKTAIFCEAASHAPFLGLLAVKIKDR